MAQRSDPPDKPAPTLSTPPPGLPGDAPARMSERDPSRYRVVREHGRGGIGLVLEARDEELGRRVALKELLRTTGEDEARFLREARLTARLEHPSIVPVHDAGRWRDSGKAFYSMKLVSGRSLQAIAQEAQGFEARIALLPNVLAVAEAIAYAHSQRIVHRDLKPANVIVGPYGETIVIDWGLAKELGDRSTPSPGGAAMLTRDTPSTAALTMAGSVMGTPAFMAPEQARGEDVDERADVYALGTMLYFVLSGAVPHEGESAQEVLRSVLLGTTKPIRVREPRVPSDLAAIVDKAMAHRREDRYRDATSLAADLRRFQTGQLVGAHAYSQWQLAVRWVRRNRALAAVTALAIVVLAVLFAREATLRQTAESARSRADAESLALLEQSGRVQLDLGRPARAAPYLAAAYQQAPERLALRALVTQAIEPLETTRIPLRGHTRDVVTAAWSRDGARVVTGSADKTVRIWDANDGKELLVLLGHQNWVEDVAFSPDGKRVASAGGQLILWDSRTGEALHTLPGGGFRIGFSPDSTVLIRGGMRGAMTVVDVASGRAILDLPNYYGDRVAAIAFAPDGSSLVTGSWDGSLTFWDTRTWKPVRTLKDHHDGLSSADISDDGKWLLTGDLSGQVNVRHADTGEIVQAFQVPHGVQAMEAWFAPDGRSIVTSSHDGSVRVWHATAGTLLRSVDTVPRGKMFDGALSPDGNAIVTTGLWGADVWRFAGPASYTIAEGGRYGLATVQPGALSPDGTLVAGVQTAEGTRISVWNPETGALVRSWPDLAQAQALAIGLGGKRILTAGEDKLAPRLWDSTGTLIARLDGHPGRLVHDVEASADGTLFATAAYDRRVVLWRADTGAPTGLELLLDGRATAVAFSPDGSRLAATDENGKMTIWSADTGERVLAIQAHPTWIQDIAYSRDGKRIVTAGRQDHSVKIWDAATGAFQMELAGHTNNAWRASFSPDGRLVASASSDRTARLWDASTGEHLRTFEGPANSAMFDATGLRLITTGDRDHVVSWNLALDERSPDEIAAFVKARSPWRLEAGRLSLSSDGAQPTAAP